MIPFNIPPYVGKELDYMKQAIENKKVKKKRDLAHKFEHCYLQCKGLCRILKSLKISAIFK